MCRRIATKRSALTVESKPQRDETKYLLIGQRVRVSIFCVRKDISYGSGRYGQR